MLSLRKELSESVIIRSTSTGNQWMCDIKTHQSTTQMYGAFTVTLNPRQTAQEQIQERRRDSVG